jgi:Uma2 family endonuclease
MARLAGEPAQPPAVPTTPTVEVWRTMSPAEQLDFQVRVLDALDATADVMGEGRPHKKAKSRTIDALGLHFKATGRAVYLAEEMAVLYPGVEAFTPDIFAVLDVEEPEEDERMAWVVADEGKGLDLVIEVLHKGKRDKDLVENVERYATLGIPEYFVYDRLRHKLHAYHLPVPGAARYQHVMPQLGRHHSTVLGLDLQVVGTDLRFLAGEAELPGSAQLIERLQGMMSSVSVRLEDAELRAERAEADAIEARARGVLAVLRARGLSVSDAARERILGERNAERLDQWLDKAVVAASIEEVLGGP